MNFCNPGRDFFVNLCKKCGDCEIRGRKFFSALFLRKFTAKPRSGKKCGEFRGEFFEKRWNVVNYFFHRIHGFHRISYINLPQTSMRWIFERNAVIFAVHFCKKCGELRWNIYFHRIHRNHRISYNNSPQSPHFLQQFTAITAFLTKTYTKTSTRVTTQSNHLFLCGTLLCREN